MRFATLKTALLATLAALAAFALGACSGTGLMPTAPERVTPPAAATKAQVSLANGGTPNRDLVLGISSQLDASGQPAPSGPIAYQNGVARPIVNGMFELVNPAPNDKVRVANVPGYRQERNSLWCGADKVLLAENKSGGLDEAIIKALVYLGFGENFFPDAVQFTLTGALAGDAETIANLTASAAYA